MSCDYLWRYLSYEKYEKLLNTRSIYFPKASKFDDRNEGQWIAYVMLNRDNENRLKPLPKYISVIEKLLSEAESNELVIKQKCLHLLSGSEIEKGLLNDILCHAVLVPIGKVEEYLLSMMKGWRKAIDIQGERKERWRSQNNIHRESTYISCWCGSRPMSKLMWELYCGNKNGVAIRIKQENLHKLLDDNKEHLDCLGLRYAVAKIMYIDNLQKPSDETLDPVFDLTQEVRNSGIVQFLVKSSIYFDEKEVRAILYTNRGARDPVVDPYPDKIGFDLHIHPGLGKQEALSSFIDKVYVHPLLSEEDPITKKIRKLHRKHDLCDLPLEVKNEVAFG